MDAERLAALYPVLYHMAEDGTWPSIRARGLLSTQALVDLYDPPGHVRAQILQQVRRRSVRLHRDDLGPAVIRNQGPLKFLDRCLTPGTTARQFLGALNGRVFFWLTAARLHRLLGAALYRDKPHTVLHVDTASLLATYADVVELAPYNTGSTFVPSAPPRGVDVFTPLATYPYEDWQRRRGRSGDPVVELTVPHAVPDVVRHVTRVERWVGGQPVGTLYTST